MRRRAAVLVLGMVVALTACGDERPATVPAPAPTFTAPATPSPTPASAPPTTAPVLTPSTAPTPTALQGPVLVLAGDGLGLAAAPGAAISRVPFGTPVATVVAAVKQALGGTPEQAALPDCGQGPRSSLRFDGFSLLVDGSTFVGWTERGSSARLLTTADGLGLRSRLEDIRAARTGVSVTVGSLGTEVVLPDGLDLLLDGGFARSQVTALSGGETCFAR